MRKALFGFFAIICLVFLFAQEKEPIPVNKEVDFYLRLYRTVSKLVLQMESELAKRRFAVAMDHDFALHDMRAVTAIINMGDMASQGTPSEPPTTQSGLLLRKIYKKLPPKTEIHLFNIAGRVVAVGKPKDLRALATVVRSLKTSTKIEPVLLRLKLLRLPRGIAPRHHKTDPFLLPPSSVIRDMVVNTVPSIACALFDGRQHTYIESLRRYRDAYGSLLIPNIVVASEGMRSVIRATPKRSGVSIRLRGSLISLLRFERLSTDRNRWLPPVETPKTLKTDLKVSTVVELNKAILERIEFGADHFWLFLQVLR